MFFVALLADLPSLKNSLAVEQHHTMIRRRKRWLVLGVEANGYPHAFILWPCIFQLCRLASFPDHEQHNKMIRQRKQWLVLGVEATIGYLPPRNCGPAGSSFSQQDPQTLTTRHNDSSEI
jgi:hypothetical protein